MCTELIQLAFHWEWERVLRVSLAGDHNWLHIRSSSTLVHSSKENNKQLLFSAL